MKFYTRSGIYKNSTGSCTFDPANVTAYSYKWWPFLKKINGLVVFNSYSYSNSTSKHQYRVKNLLAKHNIEVNLYVEAPRGLDDLGSAVKLYKNRINTLVTEITKPRSQKAKNESRQAEIRSLQNKISEIKTRLGYIDLSE